MNKTKEVRGPSTDRKQARASSELSSSIVGRDAEMGLLRGYVDRLADGVGGVVHVQGPSGIGKSRLVEDLAQTAIVGRFNLVEGRALSFGKNLAFHPFVSVIRSWAGIGDLEEESRAAATLAEALTRLPIKEFDGMLSFIGVVLGLKVSESQASSTGVFDGQARETLTVKYIRDLFVAIASAAPLVIVLEDFQWADRSSVNLLASLGRLASKAPILFIVVYIPDVGQQTGLIRVTADDIDPGFYFNIVLNPLDEEESRRLIANLLGADSLSHDVSRKLIRQGHGSPLFLVEAARLLVDEGAVVEKDGAFIETEKIRTTVIPDTLKDLLKSRLSRLNADTQDLIKTASVMEKSIMSRVLEEVSSVRGDAVTADGGLKRFASLYRESRISHNHLLIHTLGQETAYETMTEDQKRGLHLRVADTIERVFYHRLHEFFGVLAYHYGVAGAEIKAKDYLIKVGSDALGSAAFAEALSCFQEAYAIYQRQPFGMRERDEEMIIVKSIAVSLYYLGRYEESLEFLTRALTYYGETEPNNPAFRAIAFCRGLISFLISIYVPIMKWRNIPTDGDREFLTLFYMKNAALANVDSTRFLFESFYFARRFVNFDITRIQNGIAMFAGYSAVFSWTGASFVLSRRVLSFVKEKMDVKDIQSRMYYEITDMIHKFFTGQWESSVLDDNTLRLNLALGEIMHSVNYLTLHGQFAIEKGDSRTTKKVLDALYEVASIYNNTYAWAYWHTLRVKRLMKNRSFMEVLSSIDEALEYLEKHDIKILLNLLHSTKAQARVLTGDFPGSTASLSDAQQYEEAIRRLPYYRVRFLMAAIIRELRLLEDSGELEHRRSRKKAISRIDQRIKEALGLARSDASARTDLFRLIGTYCWMTGRQRKARAWWIRSIQDGQRLGALPDLAGMYEEAGRRLSEPGSIYEEIQGISAGGYLEMARDLYLILGSDDRPETSERSASL